MAERERERGSESCLCFHPRTYHGRSADAEIIPSGIELQSCRLWYHQSAVMQMKFFIGPPWYVSNFYQSLAASQLLFLLFPVGSGSVAAANQIGGETNGYVCERGGEGTHGGRTIRAGEQFSAGLNSPS